MPPTKLLSTFDIDSAKDNNRNWPIQIQDFWGDNCAWGKKVPAPPLYETLLHS